MECVPSRRLSFRMEGTRKLGGEPRCNEPRSSFAFVKVTVPPAVSSFAPEVEL